MKTPDQRVNRKATASEILFSFRYLEANRVSGTIHEDEGLFASVGFDQNAPDSYQDSHLAFFFGLAVWFFLFCTERVGPD